MKKERKKPIYGTSAMGNVFIQYRGGGGWLTTKMTPVSCENVPHGTCAGVQSRVSAAATHDLPRMLHRSSTLDSNNPFET